MSDVRSEPLFPSALEVVSTKHPASGQPLVGLVMAQRIATLTSREAVEEHIARVRAAADAAWPFTAPDTAIAFARPVEWKFEAGYVARNIRTGETRDAREYLKEAWPAGPWEFDSKGRAVVRDPVAREGLRIEHEPLIDTPCRGRIPAGEVNKNDGSDAWEAAQDWADSASRKASG
jgi:hypothetical protein